jgi:ABC-type polysaccharide/polyol phosphate export permease
MAPSTDDRVEIVPVEAPARDQWRATVADLRGTWTDRRIWLLNAIVSVGNRYRRTILGPWWLTLQTLFFVFGLALLRIGLNGGELREAIPYVGLGYIGFQLISTGVTAGSNTFVAAGNQMTTSGRPYSTYVARANASVVIDFLHDVVVIVLLALLFAIPFSLLWGWSVVAVVLIVLSSVGVGLWLGPLVARFRDIGPLVSSVMRIMFFLTPVFWSVDQVEANERAWLAWLNPFTYQLLAFRDPILGTTHPGAPVNPMVMTAILAIVNVALGLLVFWRTRPRIPYWVAE